MTVSTETAIVSYAGNGVTVSWAVPYYILESSHVRVTVRGSGGSESVKVLTTDYTVANAGTNPSTATVTAVSFTPATGETLIIERDVPATQETDLAENDSLPAETVERVFDKLTMLAQQTGDLAGRALHYPAGETLTSQLPAAAVRANKFPVFDALGNVTTSAGTGADAGLREDIASGAAGAVIKVATVAAMKALTGLVDGTRIVTSRYRTGGNVWGGGTYLYHTSPPGTADGFIYHNQDTGGGQFELVMVWPNVYHAGCYGDGATDDTTFVQAAADALLGFVFAPAGRFRCTSTITFPVATTVLGHNKAGNAYNSTSSIQSYFLHDFNGDFFVFDGSGGVVQGAGGGLDSVSLVQVFGTTGTGYGKALVLKGTTTSLRTNWFRIDNTNIETDSGNSKGQWSWNVDVDGSAPGGTDGVRDIYINNLRLVGGAGATGGMRLWCAKNVFMSNVQTNLTNSHILVSGPSGSDVTAAVYAANCVASWQLDYASGVNIIGGRIDTISSTSNTSASYIAPTSINVVPTTLPGCTLTAMAGGGWFAKKDDANPARVSRDVGYGDSTNSVQLIVGNQGTNEGGAIAQYRNGDPQQAVFGLYGRNVADTTVAAMARIEMNQISGQDYAQIDVYTGTDRKIRLYQQGNANADVSASWRPTTDNTYTLGIASLRWSNIYGVNFRPGAGTALWTSGAGTPEGSVTAVVGSLYTDTSGGAGTTLYVKESGTGNTGWVAK